MDAVDSDLSGNKSQLLHLSSPSGPVSLVHSSLSSSSASSFSSSSSPSNHHLAATSSTSATDPVVNGGNKPRSHPCENQPSLLSGIRKDASYYQLVFGLDDTSSETSLVDDLSNRLVLHGSPEENRTDVVSEPHLIQSDLTPSPHESRGSHNFLPSAISSLSSLSSPQLTINAESALKIPGDKLVKSSETLISPNSGPVPDPIRGGEEGTDGTSKDQKPSTCTCTPDDSALSKNTRTNIGDSSSSKLHPLEYHTTSDPGHEIASSSIHLMSDSHNMDQGIKPDNISLHSHSTSPTVVTVNMLHVDPLVLSSNSDAEEDTSSHTHSPCPHTPYSPILNTSGDEEQSLHDHVSSLSLTTSLPSSLVLGAEELSVKTMLFAGIAYLGSSSVNAPFSEIEANRNMHILKEQATGTEPIPVVLSIPVNNQGIVVLKDPKSSQSMATFPVKQILFCARGNAEVLLDCFCLNVKNKRSGMFQCHIFRCEGIKSCDTVFRAIGKALTTSVFDEELRGDHLSLEFQVSLEIQEEDSKGVFSSVNMEKDCFKLRQQARRRLTLTVSQPSAERSLLIMRCFGMLVSAGKDVKEKDMNVLNNMKPSASPGHSFSVMGIWDPDLSLLSSLNEETPKAVRFQYLTVAVNLILESVTEPVHFKREVKVHVSKSSLPFALLNQLTKRTQGSLDQVPFALLNQLTKKKQGSLDQVLYTLKLTKSATGGEYVAGELFPTVELRQPTSSEGAGGKSTDEVCACNPSSTQKTGGGGGRGLTRAESTVNAKNQEEESGNEEEEEEEVLLSGWGDVEGLREELLKDWGDILEHWDGKDRARPSKVIKLCRKGIPRHMRCQVWQMLTGAAHDPQLAEAYRLLISKDSPAENVINWDIKRTYMGHDYFQDESNKEALYKISKAYSIYDEQVGYCQGFSFMAAVLVLQKMPEETAFSVLVKIMKNYGHRKLFMDNFRDLHLMFFQLDKLLEESLPDLYEHLQENRIETHMYASQWFLTLYTAKFPLSIVFRILDIYLCEKIVVIFLVALSLLKIAKKDLLSLDFEGILKYFRVYLPKKFQTEDDCQLLFHNMFTFKVSEKKLSKLERDYQSFLEHQALLEDPVLRLEKDNKQLRESIHRLEQENDCLAQDLVSSKIKLRSEMDKLEERIDTLSKEAKARKKSCDVSQNIIYDLKEELKQAKDEFQGVMMRLTDEKMHYDGAIQEYKQLFRQLDEGHQKQKEELSQELLEVKAQLGSTGEADSKPVSLSSEMRLRNLEIELAQTKLALVESQCKNQELDHRIVELSSSKTWRWSSVRKK